MLRALLQTLRHALLCTLLLLRWPGLILGHDNYLCLQALHALRLTHWLASRRTSLLHALRFAGWHADRCTLLFILWSDRLRAWRHVGARRRTTVRGVALRLTS